MTAKKTARRGQDGRLRVDLIDHDHDDWLQVLASLAKQRSKGGLMLNAGYLSARQSLLVARTGKTVVGHLCFHVVPRPSDGGKPHGCVEAHLDVLHVRPGFEKDEVIQLLVFAAEKRASILRCSRLVGFG